MFGLLIPQLMAPWESVWSEGPPGHFLHYQGNTTREATCCHLPRQIFRLENPHFEAFQTPWIFMRNLLLGGCPQCETQRNDFRELTSSMELLGLSSQKSGCPKIDVCRAFMGTSPILAHLKSSHEDMNLSNCWFLKACLVTILMAFG